MSDQFFGWELLFNNVKNEIKKKEDVSDSLLFDQSRIQMCRRRQRMGNHKADQPELSSELLPKEWSANKEYVLRYKHNDEKFVLRSCHFDNNTMIFNFVQTAKLKVSNLMINYEDSVKALEGNISAVLPDHKDLIEAIQRDLITSFVTPEKKNADTKTTLDESTKSTGPLLVRDCRPLRYTQPYRNPGLDRVRFRNMLFNRLKELHSSANRNCSSIINYGVAPPASRFDPLDRNGPDRFPPEYDVMFSYGFTRLGS